MTTDDFITLPKSCAANTRVNRGANSKRLEFQKRGRVGSDDGAKYILSERSCLTETVVCEQIDTSRHSNTKLTICAYRF